MRRERALKIVLMLVGLLFTAMIYPLVLFVKEEPALDSGSAKPIRESEHNRLHCMVELCPRCRDVVPSFSKSDRTRGTDRVGCARGNRRSLDRVGSGKADC